MLGWSPLMNTWQARAWLTSLHSNERTNFNCSRRRGNGYFISPTIRIARQFTTYIYSQAWMRRTGFSFHQIGRASNQHSRFSLHVSEHAYVREFAILLLLSTHSYGIHVVAVVRSVLSEIAGIRSRKSYIQLLQRSLTDWGLCCDLLLLEVLLQRLLSILFNQVIQRHVHGSGTKINIYSWRVRERTSFLQK